jgi:hypothetical protein
MRTDRDTKVFGLAHNEQHTQMMLDILVSYAVFDPSYQYSQGMSDILSPVLVVMKDEVPVWLCVCHV